MTFDPDPAGEGQASPDRVSQRNGYRHRDLDTRVGTIDVVSRVGVEP